MNDRQTFIKGDVETMIDHVTVYDKSQSVRATRHEVLSDAISDHRPLRTDFDTDNLSKATEQGNRVRWDRLCCHKRKEWFLTVIKDVLGKCPGIENHYDTFSNLVNFAGRTTLGLSKNSRPRETPELFKLRHRKKALWELLKNEESQNIRRWMK